jgi:hypothetical protein
VFWIAVTFARPASAARTEKVAAAIDATRATSALVHTSPRVELRGKFMVSPIGEATVPARASRVVFN